jgi:hypothetical protein
MRMNLTPFPAPLRAPSGQVRGVTWEQGRCFSGATSLSRLLPSPHDGDGSGVR